MELTQIIDTATTTVEKSYQIQQKLAAYFEDNVAPSIRKPISRVHSSRLDLAIDETPIFTELYLRTGLKRVTEQLHSGMYASDKSELTRQIKDYSAELKKAKVAPEIIKEMKSGLDTYLSWTQAARTSQIDKPTTVEPEIDFEYKQLGYTVSPVGSGKEYRGVDSMARSQVGK